MLPKINTPRTANIKKISISRENTFKREASEKVIVWMSAWRPLYFPISLKSLEILSTLRTLASWGPTLKNFKEVA